MPKKKQSKQLKKPLSATFVQDLLTRVTQLEADFDELRRHTKNMIQAIIREATIPNEETK